MFVIRNKKENNIIGKEDDNVKVNINNLKKKVVTTKKDNNIDKFKTKITNVLDKFVQFATKILVKLKNVLVILLIEMKKVLVILLDKILYLLVNLKDLLFAVLLVAKDVLFAVIIVIYNLLVKLLAKIFKFLMRKEVIKFILITIGIIVVVLSIFFAGMYVEYNNNVISESPIKHLVKMEKYEDNYYYELSMKNIEEKIHFFIQTSFAGNDEKYVKEVTSAFMKLFNDEPDKHHVLYYIAVCSVESNFKMSSRSSCGAVGISQVMPNIWGDVIKKEYDITQQELYMDPYKNIYAGYRIWDNYRRKNGNGVKGANTGYLGSNVASYQNSINHRHSQLVSSIFKDIFDNKLKHETKALLPKVN